jgi:uncharacterized alpha-E superfamily protein
VLKFLLQDPLFPRAVYHCLGVIEDCLAGLPKNAATLASISELKDRLTSTRIPELALDREGLHTFIDELQIGLGYIHEQLEAAYFAH